MASVPHLVQCIEHMEKPPSSPYTSLQRPFIGQGKVVLCYQTITTSLTQVYVTQFICEFMYMILTQPPLDCIHGPV